jgi:hypothetical protein
MRPGPETFPWIVNLDDSVNWNQPLSAAMETFNDWVSTSHQYGSAPNNDNFRIVGYFMAVDSLLSLLIR